MKHLKLIESIETTLADFYGFAMSQSSTHFLLNGQTEQRGCVYVAENKDSDTLEVGIQLQRQILDVVEQDDPLVKLSNQNLDAFFVIAEEVSHFHLICNRAIADRGVSQLELEIQGEIDKILLAANLMYDQCGDAHLLPLVRKLFDEAKIHVDHDVYREANRFAADFWYALAQQRQQQRYNPMDDIRLRGILRQSYSSPLSDKLEHLDLRRAG